jgi:hypothetical protein
MARSVLWNVTGARRCQRMAPSRIARILTQGATMMNSKSHLFGRGAAFLLLSFAAACGNAGNGTSTPTPGTTPSVVSSTPVIDATDVPLNGSVSATFSEAMDPASLSATTFVLTSGVAAVPVQGTVTYANSTAVFSPAAQLESDGSYTATITTGAKSTSGDSLAADRTWKFRTGGKLSAPRVVSNTPLHGATGVAVDGIVSATFSKAMDPATLTVATFTLTSGAAASPVQGTVTYANSTAVFLPATPLDADGSYTATITTGAKSTLGVALMMSRAWSFTVRGGSSTTPMVISSTPPGGAMNVSLHGNASATFSEAMDPASLTASTFTLTSGAAAAPVQGTVTYANSTAVFSPASPLASNGSFSATITTGARSALGVAIAANHTWSFTTGQALPVGLPVNLGAAGGFVILAKSGISTVPTSAITGNIGVSPAAATSLTGFDLIADSTNVFSTSAQVVGQVYAADYALPTPSNLTTAVSDMELAFADAAGRAPDVTELGAGNIGGMTLAPGVYKWGTGLLIPTDVTLTGSATDVWIFEIAQGLTMSSATKVLLAGGALPRNVFWQVGGGVVLDTMAHIEGVVLTQTAATLATGASINGRLLAQTAVTLDGSTVVEPTP